MLKTILHINWNNQCLDYNSHINCKKTIAWFKTWFIWSPNQTNSIHQWSSVKPILKNRYQKNSVGHKNRSTCIWHMLLATALNASLLICKQPSAAKISSGVKYSRSTLNSSNVRPMVLCWFYCVHFQMLNIYCWKINADNIVVTEELIYKHWLWNS